MSPGVPCSRTDPDGGLEETARDVVHQEVFVELGERRLDARAEHRIGRFVVLDALASLVEDLPHRSVGPTGAFDHVHDEVVHGARAKRRAVGLVRRREGRVLSGLGAVACALGADEADGERGDDRDGAPDRHSMPPHELPRDVGSAGRTGSQGLVRGEAPDVLRHLLDGPVAAFAIRFHRPAYDPRQLARRPLHGKCLSLTHHVDRRGEGSGLDRERCALLQQLEQHAPERVHVGAHVEVARTPQLLGTHAGQRADELPVLGPRECAVPPRGRARDSEVDHLGHPVGVDEQVLGLEVPVQDAVSVGVGHGPQHVDEEREPRAEAEVLLSRIGHEVEPVLHVLHRDEGQLVPLLPDPAPVRAGFIQASDRRVAQPREHLGLVVEARERRRRQPHTALELQRDGTRGLPLAREPDRRHPALSQDLLELEPAHGLAGPRRPGARPFSTAVRHPGQGFVQSGPGPFVREEHALHLALDDLVDPVR